jgi:hypothetical protein
LHAQINSLFCNCAVSECREPALRITQNKWYGALLWTTRCQWKEEGGNDFLQLLLIFNPTPGLCCQE